MRISARISHNVSIYNNDNLGCFLEPSDFATYRLVSSSQDVLCYDLSQSGWIAVLKMQRFSRNPASWATIHQYRGTQDILNERCRLTDGTLRIKFSFLAQHIAEEWSECERVWGMKQLIANRSCITYSGRLSGHKVQGGLMPQRHYWKCICMTVGSVFTFTTCVTTNLSLMLARIRRTSGTN